MSLHTEMPHSTSRPGPNILFTSPEWRLCALTNEKPVPTLFPEELVAQPDSGQAHTHTRWRETCLLIWSAGRQSMSQGKREREVDWLICMYRVYRHWESFKTWHLNAFTLFPPFPIFSLLLLSYSELLHLVTHDFVYICFPYCSQDNRKGLPQCVHG